MEPVPGLKALATSLLYCKTFVQIIFIRRINQLTSKQRSKCDQTKQGTEEVPLTPNLYCRTRKQATLDIENAEAMSNIQSNILYMGKMTRLGWKFVFGDRGQQMDAVEAPILSQFI